ncbi:hypothetical protein EVAR_53994_1 [Eumeta japonica]|uniref:Uncharacterized protein n=1 Tax=Eumeta variegata TaxID=151549 RepID=A0A4C1YU85_EUMVA|nr:hypothetical protein EVAR_53994_1 [Eumeta japonica]
MLSTPQELPVSMGGSDHQFSIASHAHLFLVSVVKNVKLIHYTELFRSALSPPRSGFRSSRHRNCEFASLAEEPPEILRKPNENIKADSILIQPSTDKFRYVNEYRIHILPVAHLSVALRLRSLF